MTNDEKQEMLTVITGETDPAVLATYLTLAEGIVIRKAFPFGNGEETMPEKYDRTQVEIAAYMIQKMGAEGETQHSENGITRHYSDADIPSNLLRRILPVGVVL